MINEIQEEEQEPFSADLMNRLDLFKQHHQSYHDKDSSESEDV